MSAPENELRPLFEFTDTRERLRLTTDNLEGLLEQLRHQIRDITAKYGRFFHATEGAFSRNCFHGLGGWWASAAAQVGYLEEQYACGFIYSGGGYRCRPARFATYEAASYHAVFCQWAGDALRRINRALSPTYNMYKVRPLREYTEKAFSEAILKSKTRVVAAVKEIRELPYSFIPRLKIELINALLHCDELPRSKVRYLNLNGGVFDAYQLPAYETEFGEPPGTNVATRQKFVTPPCPKCGAKAKPNGTNGAKGLRYFCCKDPDCGHTWKKEQARNG